MQRSKKKIKLPNRNGYDVYLVPVDINIYRLDTNSPIIRVGEKEEKRYSYIDPSGGPMLSIGTNLDIGTITDIELSKEGYLIKVKE